MFVLPVLVPQKNGPKASLSQPETLSLTDRCSPHGAAQNKLLERKQLVTIRHQISKWEKLMASAITDTNVLKRGKGLSSRRSELELVDQTLFGTWCPWKRSPLVAYRGCGRDSWSEGGDRFGFCAEKCLESMNYMSITPPFQMETDPYANESCVDTLWVRTLLSLLQLASK